MTDIPSSRRLLSCAASLLSRRALATALVQAATAHGADSPFATAIVQYVPGLGAAAGYTNPTSALGSPTRFTGGGLSPQAVTPFQPAFRPEELVSIGFGGSLTVAFDHDVLDDPRNPFGIDLLVFGNAFATDLAAPSGLVGGFFTEGGRISLSADGVRFVTVPDLDADGLFPTLGWLDVGPYATSPGSVPSDFTRPVDPAWRSGAMIGLDWNSLRAAYDGSGGGVGIDLAPLGLSSVRYVRIDGPTAFGFSPEIDAVADVAPSTTPGDLDGDGDVDAADLAVLLGAWDSADGAADIDGSGLVDAADLAILLGAWTLPAGDRPAGGRP